MIVASRRTQLGQTQILPGLQDEDLHVDIYILYVN